MTFIDERELRRAYIAGIFDGEGNLTATLNRIISRISQANYPFLEYFKTRYEGGSIQPGGPREGNWVWCLSGVEKQLVFLRDIEPYLILKRKEVLIAIEILKIAPKPGYNLKYENPKISVLRDRLYVMLEEAAQLRRFGYRERPDEAVA